MSQLSVRVYEYTDFNESSDASLAHLVCCALPQTKVNPLATKKI